MVQLKLIEVRDVQTFIPALAIRFQGADNWLLAKAGFLRTNDYVLLINLVTLEANTIPDKWGSGEFNTMKVVHKTLKNEWDDIQNNEVIDVDFIIGNSEVPKVSERYADYGYQTTRTKFEGRMTNGKE